METKTLVNFETYVDYYGWAFRDKSDRSVVFLTFVLLLSLCFDTIGDPRLILWIQEWLMLSELHKSKT